MQDYLSPVPTLMSRAQVAVALGVCNFTVTRYTKAGKLPCVVIGKRCIRYKVEDVQALIKRATEAGAQR